MKNLLIIMLSSLFVFGAYAQDGGAKDKKADKETKSKKESKDKSEIEAVFISQPEGDDYQLQERREVSKPSMPFYDVEQGFNQKKKKKEQQDAYVNKEYYFPAKPKNAWQLGVVGGLASVNGDISPNFLGGAKPFVPGYTVGVNVKKSFNYMFALRMSYHFMEMWNTDTELSSISSQFSRIVPEIGTNYTANGINKLAHNSHTVAHDMTMDALVSFGNVKYHKERTKVLFNIFASAGGMMFTTWYDQLDENGNAYDYSTIDFDGSKKDVNNALNDLRNGVYETRAERSVAEGEGFLGSSFDFLPVFGGGAGLTFRLGRVVDLDIEARMMATRNDDLDGMRWEETGTLTANFDTYSTFTTGLSFKLVGKKKTEPLTMLNPMHYTYQKIAENDPERAIEELLKDDDGDGVPNRLDQEADTPEGAPVSPKGIALDSDADGVLDVNDDEPFSPPGVPVNEKGIAQLPPTPPAFDANAAFNCDEVILPSVHFDKDKYNIKPEFYAHLYNLADKMTLCPDLKIKATGMTDKDDNEKYNEQLSWNRVNAVIDYLNEKYGIDKSRFIAKYDGEANAAATSSIEQYKERKVMLEQAAPGEAGASSPAPPHPGIKAGSNR
ncbi:MAG: OOP family OmpA-OmpF porin [Chitinophagales bacterium]|jgi:OOP family OmpA-OmpF porin